MRPDVQPQCGHVLDLVLALRDDHGHVGGLQRGDLRFEIGPRHGVAGRPGGTSSAARCFRPGRLHLVVHPHRGGLVHADHHRLAREAAAGEVRGDVRRDRVQPVGAGDQVVLAGELALQPGLLRLVQLGVFQHGRHVGVEVGVGQLQLGDAVFVVERHRGLVVHRLLEVVDADVVAEDRARLLLAGHQRGAGEADERGVGQRVAHVQREDVVLAAVRLVGHDDDVGPVGELRVGLPALGVELLDQGEDVAVVLPQELAQVLAAARPDAALRLGDRARVGEVAVDLLVELLPVGDDQEGPVARQLAQDLLGEEDHRVAFAAALGVPEDAEAALTPGPSPVRGRGGRCDGGEGVVDAEVLVVLGDQLDRAPALLHEQGEVLDQVEQPRRVARAAQHGFQRDDALLPFAVDLLPVVEVLPPGRERADLAGAAVGEDDERVVREELRDGGLVVAQVVPERVLQPLVRRLQLDEDQRQAVDEPHQVGAAFVDLAGDPELRGQEEVVAVGVIPVDDADGDGLRHRLVAARPACASARDLTPSRSRS